MERISNISFSKKITIFFIVFFFSIVLSLKLGAADASYIDVFNAIFAPSKSDISLVLYEIRIPRIIAGILVGASLGMSGSIMQGVTRNPLADPGLLGVSAGATLLITLGHIFFTSLSYVGVLIFSFLGSLMGVTLVLSLGYFSHKKITTITLVLAGSAISAMLFALSQGLGLVFNVSKDVSMWTSGGLMGLTYNQVLIALPVVLLSGIFALFYAKELTAISLHEDVAISIGLSLQVTKLILYLLVALLTGIAVAMGGTLTFVGLMIPHISRFFVGYDYKKIIPTSLIIGGIFIVISDAIARVINAPYETPLIAIVSMVGLPFFIWIIKQKTGGSV
ncbi:iron ABC transporter permease [Mycoplasmatota bacterium]|nr:iron ABC transporter permease [Mycoplasmatota bacterium]